MAWFFILVICKSQSIVPPGLAKAASNVWVDLVLLDALKQVKPMVLLRFHARRLKLFYC